MKECLQQSVGSCMGCNIVEMAVDSIKKQESEAGVTRAEQIEKTYCPENAQMILSREPKKAIW